MNLLRNDATDCINDHVRHLSDHCRYRRCFETSLKPDMEEVRSSSCLQRQGARQRARIFWVQAPD